MINRTLRLTLLLVTSMGCAAPSAQDSGRSVRALEIAPASRDTNLLKDRSEVKDVELLRKGKALQLENLSKDQAFIQGTANELLRAQQIPQGSLKAPQGIATPPVISAPNVIGSYTRPFDPRIFGGPSVPQFSMSVEVEFGAMNRQVGPKRPFRPDGQTIDGDDVGLFKNQPRQDSVVKSLCSSDAASCSEQLRKFGQAYSSALATKGDTCRQAEAAVKQVTGFDTGFLHSLGSADTVRRFYLNCTTTQMPDRQRSLIGVIVDTAADLPNGGGIFFEGRSNAPIGMGVLISEAQVLTAKHVLFDGDGVSRKLSRLRFLPMVSPASPIGFKGDLVDILDPKKFSTDDVISDQVVLPLTRSVNPGVPFPRLERSYRVGDPIPVIVAGYELPYAQVESAGRHSYPDLTSWTRFVGRDGSSTCMRTIQSQPGCVHYSCNTTGGMSGAPVFVNDEVGKTLTMVVGVHHGTAITDARLTCGAPGAAGLNLASAPLPSLPKP